MAVEVGGGKERGGTGANRPGPRSAENQRSSSELTWRAEAFW